MRWMWIDQIIEHEPGRRLVAIKNVSLAEEHLHDHFPASDGLEALLVMPASLIVEGMAQTAGILVGSVSQFREKVILAKIAGATLDADVLPGHTLRYEAEIQRVDTAGGTTRGIVRRATHRGDEEPWPAIGRIDLMFSHIDRNLAGRSFPRENFVFSENFRNILRTTGLESLAVP